MGKRGKADDVLEGLGFRFERRGRITTLDTHRTKEQHRQIMEGMIRSRDRIPGEIKTLNDELDRIIRRYNSLELLAQLSFYNFVCDPDEYKEYSFKGRSPYVEHLALLELKHPRYEVRSLQMPDGAVVEEVQELLEKLFSLTSWYLGSKGADPSRFGPPPRLEQIRMDTLLNELFVRSPTYYHHWAQLLKALFGEPFLADWMKQSLGFDIDFALACIPAVERLTMGRFTKRVQQAKEEIAHLEELIKSYKATGHLTGTDKSNALVKRIAEMPDADARRALKVLAVQWVFFSLHTVLSFTASELAVEAGAPSEAVEAFLGSFSLEFGSTPTDYVIPNPTHALKLRPIIRYDEQFFCPVGLLLIWAIKPGIETKLNIHGPQSLNIEANLWERYQKHRSALLVHDALGYFKSTLPNADVYSHLNYRTVENGIEKEAELDGLVLVDKYAFLLEAKAGVMSAAARRGAPSGMVEDLKALVAEPHRQALRARDYLNSTAEPIFKTQGGSLIEISTEKIDQYFLVTVTLEDLSIFTRTLWELRDIGVFTSHDFPWAVALSDLRIVSETTTNPCPVSPLFEMETRLESTEQRLCPI